MSSISEMVAKSVEPLASLIESKYERSLPSQVSRPIISSNTSLSPHPIPNYSSISLTISENDYLGMQARMGGPITFHMNQNGSLEVRKVDKKITTIGAAYSAVEEKYFSSQNSRIKSHLKLIMQLCGITKDQADKVAHILSDVHLLTNLVKPVSQVLYDDNEGKKYLTHEDAVKGINAVNFTD